jgi:hypothetical protein
VVARDPQCFVASPAAESLIELMRAKRSETCSEKAAFDIAGGGGLEAGAAGLWAARWVVGGGFCISSDKKELQP